MNSASKRAPRPKALDDAWNSFVPEASLISYGKMALSIIIDPSIPRPPSVSQFVERHRGDMEAEGLRDGTGFLGVVNYAINGRNVDLVCRPVTYFEHRATDLCFIKKPLGDEHARWIASQASRADANGFIPSFCNLLGMDVLVMCRGDGGGTRAVFQVRSDKVVARHGMIMGSASGGLTVNDASNISDLSGYRVKVLQRAEAGPRMRSDADIYYTCASELQEELNLKAEELTSLGLRGYMHDRPESDPDALFVGTTDLTESEIRKRASSGNDNYEYSRLMFEEFPIPAARLAEIRERMSPQARAVYFLSVLEFFGQGRELEALGQKPS